MRASTSAEPGRRNSSRDESSDSNETHDIGAVATVCGFSAVGPFLNDVVLTGSPGGALAVAKTLLVLSCIALAALIDWCAGCQK